jgi:hypothetical protein
MVPYAGFRGPFTACTKVYGAETSHNPDTTSRSAPEVGRYNSK